MSSISPVDVNTLLTFEQIRSKYFKMIAPPLPFVETIDILKKAIVFFTKHENAYSAALVSLNNEKSFVATDVINSLIKSVCHEPDTDASLLQLLTAKDKLTNLDNAIAAITSEAAKLDKELRDFYVQLRAAKIRTP